MTDFETYREEEYYDLHNEDHTFFDPRVLRIAHKLYQMYFEVHPEPERIPTGVVVNLNTYQGYLLFRDTPILLPNEEFIPIDLISE